MKWFSEENNLVVLHGLQDMINADCGGGQDLDRVHCIHPAMSHSHLDQEDGAGVRLITVYKFEADPYDFLESQLLK